MSQKIIIAVMGVIILAGGGFWFYQTQMGSGTSDSKKDSASKAEKNGGLFESIKEGASDFADSFGAGAAQQCQFSGTDPESGEFMEGTIYVAGESFVMKADTVIEGEDGILNMIQHEQVMYIWSEDQEQMPGMKIDTSMFDELPEEERPPSILEELRKPDSGFQSRCKGWSPRADSFEPPKDVEFMDLFGGLGAMFGEMMQGGMGEGGFGTEGSFDAEYDMGSSDDWGY